MGIKLKTPQQAIERMVERRVKDIKSTVIEALSMLGEECVTIMRNDKPNDYTDRSHNLRSSTGFMIVQDGKVRTRGGLEEIDGKGKEGVKAGEKAVKEVAKEFPNDIVLIVVAGMKYGVYVERLYGKDVITSAKLFAKKEALRFLREAGLIL